MDLTGLLSVGDGLALPILRQRDNTDVIVDTRLQSIDSVITNCWQNKVLEDGYALACCHHRDPVTGDGCGVER